jgi:hypothetical protein
MRGPTRTTTGDVPIGEDCQRAATGAHDEQAATPQRTTEVAGGACGAERADHPPPAYQAMMRTVQHPRCVSHGPDSLPALMDELGYGCCVVGASCGMRRAHPAIRTQRRM